MTSTEDITFAYCRAVVLAHASETRCETTAHPEKAEGLQESLKAGVVQRD
ncbi:hypothetical protein [Mycobacterium sp.]|nr:hypothetical protein [Mycobacterium sp.]HME78749.1 hypothetical protein [Mycobacterium sp.]